MKLVIPHPPYGIAKATDSVKSRNAFHAVFLREALIKNGVRNAPSDFSSVVAKGNPVGFPRICKWRKNASRTDTQPFDVLIQRFLRVQYEFALRTASSET